MSRPKKNAATLALELPNAVVQTVHKQLSPEQRQALTAAAGTAIYRHANAFAGKVGKILEELEQADQKGPGDESDLD